MKEFTERLMGLLEERMESGTSIHTEEIRKNNGVCRIGLCIRRKGSHTAPILYLEPYFQAYLEGTTIEEIADAVSEWFQNQKNSVIEGTGWSDIFDTEKIVCRLVNWEANRELLENVPYQPFLDLAVVFCILVGNRNDGYGTLTVNHAMREKMGLSVEALYQLAFRNMKQQMPYSCRSIYEVLPGSEELKGNTVSGKLSLYILTNHVNLHGAAEILGEGVLEEVADRLESDLILLPSSVHEFLVLPDNGAFEAKKLIRLLREINQTMLLKEERLSDNVYVFRRETGRVSILGETESKEEVGN